MAVYLAASAAAFFYLMMLPVRFGALWKTGGRLKIGLTIGLIRFSAHGSIKYLPGSGFTVSLDGERSGRTREFSLTGRPPPSPAAKDGRAALSQTLKYLRRRISPRCLKAFVHLSLPDAAQTAFWCGILRSSLSAVRAARPSLPLSASVTADFRSMHTRLYLCGILSCRLGHIMAAGLIWCREYLSRRIHSWTTDSRSKAS